MLLEMLLNAKKTEMITYNQPIFEIKSVNGEKIKNVEDFKYQQALQNMEI